MFCCRDYYSVVGNHSSVSLGSTKSPSFTPNGASNEKPMQSSGSFEERLLQRNSEHVKLHEKFVQTCGKEELYTVYIYIYIYIYIYMIDWLIDWITTKF